MDGREDNQKVVGARITERRRTARLFCSQEIAVRPLSSKEDSDFRWASVQNISANGIGLLLSSHFKSGTKLVMEWRAPDGSTLRAIGRIVHGKRCSHGNSFLGCVFERPFADDAFCALHEEDDLEPQDG